MSRMDAWMRECVDRTSSSSTRERLWASFFLRIAASSLQRGADPNLFMDSGAGCLLCTLVRDHHEMDSPALDDSRRALRSSAREGSGLNQRMQWAVQSNVRCCRTPAKYVVKSLSPTRPDIDFDSSTAFRGQPKSRRASPQDSRLDKSPSTTIPWHLWTWDSYSSEL